MDASTGQQSAHRSPQHRAVLQVMMWVCLSACPLAAAAQPANTDAAPGPPEAMISSGVVVTSTGAAAPRRSHAGNIATIPETDVDFIAPEHSAGLLNRVPGVYMQQGSGQEGLASIRSPILTGGAGAGSFLYLEDGIALRAPGFANVNGLFEAFTEDAGRLEVVRGPAGALYGSNAVHGLVNVLSRPPPATPVTTVRLRGGPHGLWDARSSTGGSRHDGPGDLYGFRAAAFIAHDGGFRDQSGSRRHKAQWRYDRDHGRASLRATLTGFNLRQETASYVEGAGAYRDRHRENPNPEAYRNADAIRAAVRLERDLGPGLTLAVTPYGRANTMDFLLHFLPGAPLEENSHRSLGVQSSLTRRDDTGRELIFGLDAEYTRGKLKETQDAPTVFGTFVQGVHYDYAVDALVLAPYAQARWRLDERTFLQPGLRYEFTRYAYRDKTGGGITGRFLRPADRNDIFHDVTPKLGLVRVFSPEATGFINLAAGARAPQTADLYRLQSRQQPGEVDSERIYSVEVGLRGVWRGVSHELTAYHMRKTNFHFRDSEGFNVTGGKTRHTGIELDFARPLPWHFTLSGALTWARHVYGFTREITTPGVRTESIRKGNDVDSAPRTLANVRLDYETQGWRAGQPGWRAELEWEHTGAYYTDAANTHRYPGHDLFNLRARVRPGDNLTLHAWLLNLTGKAHATRADFFRGHDRYFPGERFRVVIGAEMDL